jgi:hypothetical protein
MNPARGCAGIPRTMRRGFHPDAFFRSRCWYRLPVGTELIAARRRRYWSGRGRR